MANVVLTFVVMNSLNIVSTNLITYKNTWTIELFKSELSLDSRYVYSKGQLDGKYWIVCPITKVNFGIYHLDLDSRYIYSEFVPMGQTTPVIQKKNYARIDISYIYNILVLLRWRMKYLWFKSDNT